jgi:hypothetical protein
LLDLAFTRVTACTLALSPIRDTLIEGFSHFVTFMTAPIASGWSVCRVGLAPTGKRRLVTAHTHGGHSSACLADIEWPVVSHRIGSRPPYAIVPGSRRRDQDRAIDEYAKRGLWCRRSKDGTLMSKKFILILVAVVLCASSPTTAVAGNDQAKASDKKHALSDKPLQPCEQGRYWCAKRAECIKTGTRCRYLQDDGAF